MPARFLLIPSLFPVLICACFYWFSLHQVNRTQSKIFLNDLLIGAHRGLALDAPENTLSAFKKSKKNGADSVEFDLEFTKDGVPVVLHDDTVDRTTNGTGSIRHMNFSEVQKLNAGAKFFKKDKYYPFEKIPTLNEVVNLCVELNVKMFIDVKHFHPNLIITITELFKKREFLYQKVAICSFLPPVIYQVKRADPKIITGHIWHHLPEPRYRNLLLSPLWSYVDKLYNLILHELVWKFTGAELILTEKHSVSEDYIKMWRERGVQVVAWTVNDYHEKLYYIGILKCPFLTDKLSDIQKEMKSSDKFYQSKDDSPPASEDDL